MCGPRLSRKNPSALRARAGHARSLLCSHIKTGAKTIHHEHHLKIQNHDRRAAGQTNSAGQPAAGLIQPFTNSVQHVRRCRCGPVRRFHGTRLRGFDGDVCHTVHRLSDRLEQWRQRAGRPLLRCRAPQGRQQDRPFGAAGQSGRRCAAAVRRPVRLACAAGAAEHQGGPAARCDFDLRVYFLGMPALALYNFGNAVFSAIGETKSRWSTCHLRAC